MQEETSSSATTPRAVETADRRLEELRQLLSRLDAAHDLQSQKLARELHHKIVGALSAVRMECDWLLRPQRTGDAMRPRLQRLSEELAETIQFTRNLIGELWPAIVGHLGFSTALQQHVADVKSRTGASVQASIDGDVDDLPEPVAIELYRLIQHVLEHCPPGEPGGCAVSIALRRSGDSIELRIEYDALTAVDGDVLLLTEERVRRLGGQLTRGSSQRGGNLVDVVLPAKV